MTGKERMWNALTGGPVEPLRGGDLTMVAARDLAGDRLALCGNLPFDELEHSPPERVRERVREILATGTRCLVLAASAGPISRITPRMATNYRVWIEEALG